METNNWGNLVARHAPELKALDIEAMQNPYMTYPEPGWLPPQLAKDSLDAQGKYVKSVAWSWGVMGVAFSALAFVGGLTTLPIAAMALTFILGGRSLEQLDSSREQMGFSPDIAAVKGYEATARIGAA